MSYPKTRIASLVIACLTALVLILSSCQGQQQTKAYSRDGYMGMTDVNPNVPMNPSYHTYRNDTRAMEQAARSIPGVVVRSITINGPNARVRLSAPGVDSAERLESIRQHALQQLTEAAPRYKMDVTVSAK